MAAFVFQNLCFDLGPRKLVIFRTDPAGIGLPHLTLSWGNPTREIDLHITPRHPKDANDRDSIIKIPENELIEFFDSLGQQFSTVATTTLLKLFFPVRGSWLRTNYYKVLQPGGGSSAQWLLRATPKIRGKYRADKNTLREIPKHSLRQPTTERLAELRVERQVWAVCTRGWNRGHILVLHYMPWRLGILTWVAIDYDDAPEFCSAVQRVLSDPLDSLVTSALKRIHDELRLEEIGW